MIVLADIECLLIPDSTPGISRSSCAIASAERSRPAVEILYKDKLVIAQFSVGRGNNNGNGNVGNNNGNFNSGNNNGNGNIGNNNGNCFTNNNNENNNQQMYNWDYRRLMEELKRCGAVPRYVP